MATSTLACVTDILSLARLSKLDPIKGQRGNVKITPTITKTVRISNRLNAGSRRFLFKYFAEIVIALTCWIKNTIGACRPNLKTTRGLKFNIVWRSPGIFR